IWCSDVAKGLNANGIALVLDIEADPRVGKGNESPAGGRVQGREGRALLDYVPRLLDSRAEQLKPGYGSAPLTSGWLGGLDRTKNAKGLRGDARGRVPGRCGC